uniref:Uncharacterized protein n=1 Tax=Timema cristinae TaxID=61476 RepID=A0A7R9H5N4_TIMCR|nr:unnamed protein product [Timema cristinae]
MYSENVDCCSPLSEDRRPQYLSSQENLSRGPSPSSPASCSSLRRGVGVLINEGISAGSLEVFELAALLNQF